VGASDTTISSESSYMVTNTSHAMTTTFMFQSNLVNDGSGSNATRQAAILEQVFSFSNISQQASLCQIQQHSQYHQPSNQIQQHSSQATFSLSDLSFSLATAPVTIKNATVLLLTTAGSHTSNNVTTVTTYYLLLNPRTVTTYYLLLNPRAGRLVGGARGA